MNANTKEMLTEEMYYHEKRRYELRLQLCSELVDVRESIRLFVKDSKMVSYLNAQADYVEELANEFNFYRARIEASRADKVEQTETGKMTDHFYRMTKILLALHPVHTRVTRIRALLDQAAKASQ